MIRAVARLFAYGVFTLACMPAQAFLLRFRPELAVRFPVWYHKQFLRLFGIKLEVMGQPCGEKPCLYVANHSSYLDIPVLGSILPASFVAKIEMNSWPFFKWLARLQRTMFIDRRVSKVSVSQTELGRRLTAGDSMILFPEGTSSDGVRVLPFRRALFQTALDHAAGISLAVQPISIFCVGMNGLVADRVARQTFAWYGDMCLMPHLWQFAQLRGCVVRVVFHPPLNHAELSDRNALATAAERAISAPPDYRAARLAVSAASLAGSTHQVSGQPSE